MQDTVLRSMITGVYVLTAYNQGRINGTTVAWAVPVAYEPLLVMVSLAGIRVSHDMVKESGYFGLNALSRDQVELGRHFGFTTARETDKFSEVEFRTSDYGIPIIKGAHSFIECRVVDTFPAGDHTMFVGEVISANVLRDEGETLIFRQEDFF